MHPSAASLIDHIESPRNEGAMASPDAVGHAILDERGPRTTIYLSISGSRIERATFRTFGCAVSIACCSLLTEIVAGQLPSDCFAIDVSYLVKSFGGIPPTKMFCAEMAVAALRNALNQVQSPSAGTAANAEQ